MRFNPLLPLAVLLAFAAGCSTPPPVAPEPTVAAAASATTDPAYRLIRGDRITVALFGQPDLNSQQIVDAAGNVRLPLIGEVALAGLTVREAEALIENTYRAREMLRRPQATLMVTTYAAREVSVLGAVRSPGTLTFPPDLLSLDLRDVIARQGGFTPVAKADAVSVTRRQPDGREVTVVVDVGRMMFGGQAGESQERFLIYPGDRVFVPERLF